MFQGVDLTTLNDKQLTMLRRHDIGFIFQSFNLLPMFTAKQNILMPLTLAGKKPSFTRSTAWMATGSPCSTNRWDGAACIAVVIALRVR